MLMSTCCRIVRNPFLNQRVRVYGTIIIVNCFLFVGPVQADQAYEIPLERVESSCSAYCEVNAVAGNDFSRTFDSDYDDAAGETYAMAVVAPGPAAAVSDPYAIAGGVNYSHAQIGSAQQGNELRAAAYPNLEAANEPGAGATVEDLRISSVLARWVNHGYTDDTWIESTITIVNESGEGTNGICDIWWAATSDGSIRIGGTYISYRCNYDGSIDVSGTLINENGAQDISGTYYGTVLTFNARENIAPEVEFDTEIIRGAEGWIHAGQQCSEKALGLDTGGWASATVRAYQWGDPN